MFAVILPAALVNVSFVAFKLTAVMSLLERSVLVAYVEVMAFPLPSLAALVALEALPLIFIPQVPLAPVPSFFTVYNV